MQMLFDRHQQKVYAMAYRLTGSTADAEDVVQESFLKAFRSLKSFRGDAAFGTWLCRIAINTSRDLYKKKSRMRQKTGEDGMPVEANGLGVMPKSSDTLAKKRLEAALARLSEGYREVLVMHDVMDMGHEEIAGILGIQPGTSKSQLHKARARMRALLLEPGATS